jgi:beta-aspartyl-peptidase (threonine type)
MSPEVQAEYAAALDAALDAGVAVLERGGTAPEAVEAAVVALEDDPHFNAARGAVLTYDGTIELDAAVMDGANRAAGAVAGVRGVKNPVSLARAVMEDGTHVFLPGKGAEEFARAHGSEFAAPEWFETPERRRQWEEMRAKATGWFDAEVKFGTVGAVACDAQGHVAAATSTGGLTGKRWGRIGDSPVIGAGTYADDRACAVSATGSGEYFIRAAVAHEICARIRLLGEDAQTAADAVIAEVGELGGDGGVIVATPGGDAVFAFNTPGMYRARADAAGLREVAIFEP